MQVSLHDRLSGSFLEFAILINKHLLSKILNRFFQNGRPPRNEFLLAIFLSEVEFKCEN